MKRKKLFLILFPLILGVLIYVVYRSRNLFYFKIIKSHSLFYDQIIEIRKVAWTYRKFFPLWVVYSLPDGLWLFSFGAALLIDRIFYLFHFFLFTGIYIFMIGFEFVQKYLGGHGSLIGTYDPLDILFFTIGYISIVIISKFLHKKDNITKRQITLENKKNELIYDFKIIVIFSILSVLPTLF